MRTVKLTVAYDGTRLVGWQRQADGESVQGLLEEALARFEGAPVSVQGAGRTDAGVHAFGQVASVRLTCEHEAATLTRALNAQLPEDVRVLSVEDVASDFHARFSARAKTYNYHIGNAPIATPFGRTYVWHIAEPLEIGAMQHAAAMLVGTHDFAAFRSAGSDTAGTIRTVTRSQLAWREPSSVPHESSRVLVYEVSGNGFLRHMVRAIVGTLVEVGRGRRAPEAIAALLDGGSRAEAGATAPPHGLFLVGVDYD
jgi:tRNA pseudouridine38-40 synthase